MPDGPDPCVVRLEALGRPPTAGSLDSGNQEDTEGIVFYQSEFSSHPRIRNDTQRHGPIESDCSLIVPQGTLTYVSHTVGVVSSHLVVSAHGPEPF